MKADYIGVSAYGVKMGAIIPNTDLQGEIIDTLKKIDNDDMLDDGDIICITESIVARAQDNYVKLDEIAEEIHEKHGIHQDYTVLVVFPISSRNRFSAILRSIARAVSDGKVIVQMSFPCDEVGNQIIDADLDIREIYDYDELRGRDDINFNHPITGINYLEYYKNIIENESAESELKLSNASDSIISEDIDAVIISSIHSRIDDLNKVRIKTGEIDKDIIITDLTQICNKGKKKSDWGLLGSNLSTGEKLKLAPKNPFRYVEEIQDGIRSEIGKSVEVLIFGDGAYKDPESGIYELADPVTAFGYTKGISDRFREGNKYKYLVDQCLEKGYSRETIVEMINSKNLGSEDEGTTPRKIKDLVASLADLISGSADAGTPIVLVKNFI